MFPFTVVPAYNLPIYASQRPLPDATQDSVRGCSLGFTAAVIADGRLQRACKAQRSSNRACRFPAPGFPTGFTARHTTAGRSLLVSGDDTSARDGLRQAVELSLKVPDFIRRCQAHHQSLNLTIFKSTPEVGALCSTGITRHQRSYCPVRLPPCPPPDAMLRPLPSSATGLPL